MLERNIFCLFLLLRYLISAKEGEASVRYDVGFWKFSLGGIEGMSQN